MSTTAPELVGPEEIAKRFGVSVLTVRAWVRAGRLPYIRVSPKVTRFRMAEVERALTHNPKRNAHAKATTTT